ncbi:MAG: FmdE family protein [Candidatus Bathyarchaeia archaeon]
MINWKEDVNSKVEDALKRAVEIHGHLGPFLVLGVKMGLLAKSLLNKRIQRCEVEVICKKPYLCTVDGIRAIIGDGIAIKEGKGITATFHDAEGAQAILTVKEPIVKKYAQVPWELCEEAAHEVLRESEENLLAWRCLTH